jgi:hypothetical protein
MRLVSIRLLLPALLFASFAAPSSAHALPLPIVSHDAPFAASGIYRLTLSAKHRAPKTVHLVLQANEQGMSGVLIDSAAELGLTNIQLEGDVLHATIMTSEGAGALEIKLSAHRVSGTLKVGREPIIVEGEHFQ